MTILKKPSMVFSTSSFEKRGFQMTHIFNGLQPPKMAVHPCTARSLLKNMVFQQAASPYVTRLLLLLPVNSVSRPNRQKPS
jgi:hypothetical protein